MLLMSEIKIKKEWFKLLKPKVAKEILKVCKSKQEITQMFLDKYGSKKAIRLIKRETARSQDDDGRLILIIN